MTYRHPRHVRPGAHLRRVARAGVRGVGLAAGQGPLVRRPRRVERSDHELDFRIGGGARERRLARRARVRLRRRLPGHRHQRAHRHHLPDAPGRRAHVGSSWPPSRWSRAACSTKLTDTSSRAPSSTTILPPPARRAPPACSTTLAASGPHHCLHGDARAATAACCGGALHRPSARFTPSCSWPPSSVHISAFNRAKRSSSSASPRRLYRATHEREADVRRYEYWRAPSPLRTTWVESFDDLAGFVAHQNVSEHHEAGAVLFGEVIEDIRLEWVDLLPTASPLVATATWPPRPYVTELERSCYERFAGRPTRTWWNEVRDVKAGWRRACRGRRRGRHRLHGPGGVGGLAPPRRRAVRGGLQQCEHGACRSTGGVLGGSAMAESVNTIEEPRAPAPTRGRRVTAAVEWARSRCATDRLGAPCS